MFAKWLDTLIDEKGYDLEQMFQVEGPEWGTNFIPLGCVVEAKKSANKDEQAAIKTMLVKLDFVNANCLDYFRHLAQALAQ